MIGALLLSLGLGVLVQKGTGESLSTLRGVTRTVEGAVLLPGVEVSVIDPESGRLLSQAVSDREGRFVLSGLPAETVRVEAYLDGFSRAVRDGVVLAPGREVTVDLNLAIAPVSETVEVSAHGEEVAAVPQTGASVETLPAEMVDVAPVPGSDFTSLLPLLPGVVRGPDGRINVKGGQSTQTGLLVNNASAVDPVTGNFGIQLPVDAIDSVTLLPNPYAAEYGRFSSGVSAIATRRGTDAWRVTVNNFIPRLRYRNGKVLGVESFTPRFAVSGPLVPGQLHLAQSFRYQTVATEVPVRPEPANDQRLESFESFTQLDAGLGPRHHLTGSLAFFPRNLDFVNENTFNPPEVTPNFHERGYGLGVSETSTLASSAVLESSLAFRSHDADVFGQGESEMEIRPEENSGNFFNRQHRDTLTWQWLETLTLHRADRSGDHLFKLGFDLVHSRFDGESESRAVNILRADGSLSQRMEFGAPSRQDLASTDFSAFAQDRWRVHDRLLFELGARVDRDGVLDKTNLAPRLGFVLSLEPEDRTVVRGGAGVFVGQTPLNVKAFETYEAQRVTHFDSGGVGIGDPITYVHRATSPMETPSSFIWNLEYDQRVGERLLFKVNHLRRSGVNEFLIDPRLDAGGGSLNLESRGRSRYWEVELTARYAVKEPSAHRPLGVGPQPPIQEKTELIWTYVRSQSMADLNAFDRFFGNFRQPVIRGNEYSLADTDVPHRFLFRGSLSLPDGWLLSPLLEVRSGFPYSLINEDQDFVGPRNRGGRFPRLVGLDVDIQRRVKIGKLTTRIGIRVLHVLGNFTPRDVQANIDAASFGTFSNGIQRRFRLTFQIE